MAQIKNLYIDQGSSFAAIIEVNKLVGYETYDLTNTFVYAQIKKSAESINLTANFHATIIPTTGQIIIYLTPQETALIHAGRYEYNVLIEDKNKNTVIRIIEGIVTINPGVTQIA